MNDSSSHTPPAEVIAEVTPEPVSELASEAVAAPALRTYLGISLFWFAISFFWGAMLSLVLPDRVAQIVGEGQKERYLALLASSGAFVSAVTQIVFGALSDNCTHPLGRRRPYLIVGVLGTSLSLLFFPGAQTIGALLGVYIGIQLFLNVANGPYQALMPDMVPAQYHGRASAYLGISLLLGRIGGPAVAGLLLNSGPQGLQHLTWVFIGLLNALMIANVVLLKETPHTEREGLGKTFSTLLRVPLRQHPSFGWLMVSRFGIMLGVYTVTFCLLYYIRDTLGQGEVRGRIVITQFMILATVTGLIGTLPTGIASDRFSKKLILVVANSVCIVAGAAFAMAQDLNTAFIAVGIFGLGFGVFSAVDWALACNLLPPGAPAKYMGIWSLSDVLPQVVAPLIAGPVAYAINQSTPGGGYRFLMGLSIFYFFLGTVAISFIKENPVPEKVPKAVEDTV